MNDIDQLSLIKDMNEKWMNDFLKGDVKSVGTHFTEDAISLAPGLKSIVGKKGIIEYCARAMKFGADALNIKSK